MAQEKLTLELLIGHPELDRVSYISQLYATLSEEEFISHLELKPREISLFKDNGLEAIEDIIEARLLRKRIISQAKDFFRNEIARAHILKTKQLGSLSEFNLNPFLDKYKANFLLGSCDAKSVATALVLGRSLGPSINTIFGNKIQRFCVEVLEGLGSPVPGIDIEFLDMIDGRKKYCQVKGGPNTINKDDVDTIKNHFKGIINIARTNSLDVRTTDMIVGVFYGEPNELSSHYVRIDATYPVYVGAEFWERLTGDPDFYQTLSDSISEIASEFDGREILESVINKLTEEIIKQTRN